MRREYDFSMAERGPVVPVAKGMTRLTIRLDDDVLQWFRDQIHAAGGGNYQTLINQTLREHIEGPRELLEDTLRRVIREELRKACPAGPVAVGFDCHSLRSAPRWVSIARARVTTFFLNPKTFFRYLTGTQVQ